jgi:FixJ family two-component response regulator
MAKSPRIVMRIGSLSAPGRVEGIMHLLLEGFTTRTVAQALGCSQTHIQRVKASMCARAERDIAMARVKLWMETVRKAA